MPFSPARKILATAFNTLVGALMFSVPSQGQSVYIAAFQPSLMSANYLDISLHEDEFWRQTTFLRLGSLNAHPTIDGPSTKAISPAGFLEGIRGESRDGILVVVHGFDTTEQRALTLAVDVAKHTGRHGAIVLFYWPSYASLFAYHPDTMRAYASGGGLAVLLMKLSGLDKKAPVPVDIFAFSLGSVLALDAVVSTPPDISRYIVLLAPAADQRTFRPRLLEQLYREGYKRVTVYESDKDWALRMAKVLGDEPLGLSLQKLPGWEVIDVSSVCRPSFWAFLWPISKIEKSHYYLACPAVATDVEQLFNGLAPEQRKLKAASDLWRIEPTSVNR